LGECETSPNDETILQRLAKQPDRARRCEAGWQPIEKKGRPEGQPVKV